MLEEGGSFTEAFLVVKEICCARAKEVGGVTQGEEVPRVALLVRKSSATDPVGGGSEEEAPARPSLDIIHSYLAHIMPDLGQYSTSKTGKALPSAFS